jgi:hypothetical protein
MVKEEKEEVIISWVMVIVWSCVLALIIFKALGCEKEPQPVFNQNQINEGKR